MKECRYRFRFLNHEVEGSGPAKAVKIVGLVLLGLAGVTVLGLVFGLLVRWLWNALMPVVFGLPEVGFWQAVGLVVLAHLLFGGDHSHRVERSRKGKAGKDSFQTEMENDYRRFWSEEGREAFRNWLSGNNVEKDREEAPVQPESPPGNSVPPPQH